MSKFPSIIPMFKDRASATGLASAAGMLAGAALLEPVIDDVGTVVADRYKAINSPIWDAMGSAQLYGDYMSLAEYENRAKALLKLKYEKPVDITGEVASEAIKGIGKSLKDTSAEYRTMRAFDRIENTPQVRALGREKARQVYDQVAALAPGVIRKAPNVALSIMNDVIMTDSTALRPETAMALTRAAGELSKVNG